MPSSSNHCIFARFVVTKFAEPWANSQVMQTCKHIVGREGASVYAVCTVLAIVLHAKLCLQHHPWTFLVCFCAVCDHILARYIQPKSAVSKLTSFAPGYISLQYDLRSSLNDIPTDLLRTLAKLDLVILCAHTFTAIHTSHSTRRCTSMHSEHTSRHQPHTVATACADAPMPKLGPISALRHRRTLSSELAMTPRRAPESPMGNTSPSMGSPAAENRPKPWPGVILYGVFASLVIDCLPPQCMRGLQACSRALSQNPCYGLAASLQCSLVFRTRVYQLAVCPYNMIDWCKPHD